MAEYALVTCAMDIARHSLSTAWNSVCEDFLSEKFNDNGKCVVAGVMAASIIGFLGASGVSAALAGSYLTGLVRYISEDTPFWNNSRMYDRRAAAAEDAGTASHAATIAAVNHQIVDSASVATGTLAGLFIGVASAENWFVAAGGAVLCGIFGFVAGKAASVMLSPLTLGLATAAEFVAKDIPKRCLR